MIVTEEQLLQATGYSRPADMEKCLHKQGIKFFYGKGKRVWTTTDLLAKSANGDRLNGPVEFED